MQRRFGLVDTTEASFDHCLLHNAKSVYFLTQAFARRTLSRPCESGACYSSTIISSISAVAASTNRGDYCVSKAAAAMVAKVFDARLAGHGVQVFVVQPGIIETDMLRPVMPAYRKRIEQDRLTFIRRPGQPPMSGPWSLPPPPARFPTLQARPSASTAASA